MMRSGETLCLAFEFPPGLRGEKGIRLVPHLRASLIGAKVGMNTGGPPAFRLVAQPYPIKA